MAKKQWKTMTTMKKKRILVTLKNKVPQKNCPLNIISIKPFAQKCLKINDSI